MIRDFIESGFMYALLGALFFWLFVLDMFNASIFFFNGLDGLALVMFGLFISIGLNQLTLFVMYSFNNGRAGIWLRLILLLSNLSVGWFALHFFFHAKEEMQFLSLI